MEVKRECLLDWYQPRVNRSTLNRRAPSVSVSFSSIANDIAVYDESGLAGSQVVHLLTGSLLSGSGR